MKIPQQIQFILQKLQKSGFKGYIVGGCVRDILRNSPPKDWDIATDAKPEQIQKLFEKSYLDNKFGTVTVVTQSKDPSLKEIEITPFRIDEKYTDRRHPDKIRWAKTIEEDLARRDFTINAMAMEIQNSTLKLTDPFNGKKDLKEKTIRAVRDPKERFSEDALRMMRAVRFAVTLDPFQIWKIEKETQEGIKKNAPLLKVISKERIRDELVKIINSPNGARGIEILRRLNLLHYIIPELEEGFGVWQNKHHIYQIYQHLLLSLNYACLKNFSKEVRIAALLHDIAKPRTKEGEGPDATFYGHEVVGSKMAYKILKRLKRTKGEFNKFSIRAQEIREMEYNKIFLKNNKGDELWGWE